MPCDCCECTNDDDDDEKFVERTLKFHDSKSFEKNPSKRFLSLEVEIYGCTDYSKIDRVCDKWSSSVVDDGSLPSTGFEINTAPTNGDLFIEHMTELGAALKAGGAYVEKDCGCHIHIDGRDMDFYQMTNLARLYSKLEDGLFKLIPNSRRRSKYCRPCGKNFVNDIEDVIRERPDYEEAMARALYKNDKKYLHQYGKTNKEAGARFIALNMQSLIYRGTAECRMHAGTTDTKKMINWGILWASILDIGARRSNFDDLPENSFEAVLEMCPTEKNREWCIARYEELN